MVAHAETPNFSPASIKLLDLLTNRYHLGLVRESSRGALRIELPANSRLQAGQRIHYVLADDQPLVSRQTMRRAVVSQIAPADSGALNLELAPL